MPVFAALMLCTVVGISDGDTLTARCDAQTIKVRLAEIDAPEH
jgi:endonuclease YncB( thermonuclease family)